MLFEEKIIKYPSPGLTQYKVAQRLQPISIWRLNFAVRD